MQTVFTHIVYLAIGAPIALFLVYHKIGPYLITYGEVWLFGKPIPRHQGQPATSIKMLISNCLRGKIHLYLLSSFFLWTLVSISFASLTTGIIDAEKIQRTRRTTELIQKGIDPANKEETVKNVENTLLIHIKTTFGKESDILQGLIPIFIAVLSFCLIRIAAVRYHPSLGRGLLLTGILSILIVGPLFIIFLDGTSELILRFMQRPEMPIQIVFWAFLSIICGLVTEGLLWFCPFESWGLKPGATATIGARYVCIVCGQTAAINNEKLGQCTNHGGHYDAGPEHPAEGRFRRDTAGW